MEFKYLALAGGIALGGLSLPTLATPITGEVTFGMSVSTLDSSGNQTGLQNAIEIDVANDIALVTNTPTGALSALSWGDTVTYYDFFLDGTGLPFDPLWTGNGISFSLTSLTVNTQTSTNLGVTGEGIMSGAGYDDTMYMWSFSSDTVGGGEFRAASATNVPVPEPGTLALLGLGLAGLGAARRRQTS